MKRQASLPDGGWWSLGLWPFHSPEAAIETRRLGVASEWLEPTFALLGICRAAMTDRHLRRFPIDLFSIAEEGHRRVERPRLSTGIPNSPWTLRLRGLVMLTAPPSRNRRRHCSCPLAETALNNVLSVVAIPQHATRSALTRGALVAGRMPLPTAPFGDSR